MICCYILVLICPYSDSFSDSSLWISPWFSELKVNLFTWYMCNQTSYSINEKLVAKISLLTVQTFISKPALLGATVPLSGKICKEEQNVHWISPRRVVSQHVVEHHKKRLSKWFYAAGKEDAFSLFNKLRAQMCRPLLDSNGVAFDKKGSLLLSRDFSVYAKGNKQSLAFFRTLHFKQTIALVCERHNSPTKLNVFTWKIVFSLTLSLEIFEFRDTRLQLCLHYCLSWNYHGTNVFDI